MLPTYPCSARAVLCFPWQRLWPRRGCPQLAASVPSITDTTGAKAAPQDRGTRHRSVQDGRRRDGCLTPENLEPVPAGCHSTPSMRPRAHQMDRAKVREVMDLTLCTEARARAALAAANGDQRAAVNEVLSPTTPSLHERTLQGALLRRGQTADEAFADRDLREARQRSMGSGRSPAEEREMVERLRLHTDTTRVEARAALVACGWHEGRAAEQLLPAQIYLSPQDRRAEKIRQVREIARVDARWAELALDACDGDAEAAVAFVCGGMSPPSRGSRSST